MHQSELARKISFCHLKKKDKKITLEIKKLEFVQFQKTKNASKNQVRSSPRDRTEAFGKTKIFKKCQQYLQDFLILSKQILSKKPC